MKTFSLFLLCLCGFQAQAVTIGIEQPDDGTSYALICEKIESIQLIVNGDVKWGGLPTWKSVKGSARVEPCPLSQGNWINVPTMLHRNYQITVRLIRVDSEGIIISNRVLPPYAWFERGSKRPMSPIILLPV